MQVFKILSATAVKLHFTRKSEEFLQCRSKFWNLLGNLSQALETCRTPPIFDYSLSNGGLKSLIWANQSDQKFLTWPKLFDRKNDIFSFDFLAFPGAPRGPRTKNSENYFYIQLNARRERERPTSGKTTLRSLIKNRIYGIGIYRGTSESGFTGGSYPRINFKSQWCLH